MSVEAQRLISVSFGKIATFRKQRGGLNLRKNLLVSYVIHNARTVIYEQMYGLQRSHDSYESEDHETDLDCNEDDDETAKPEWNDQENNENELSEENHETETARKCELELNDNDDEREEESDKENCVVRENVCEDKENIECEKTQKNSCSHDRRVLGDIKQQTPCWQTCCNKRKRSELEEACESISPKRCKFDSESSNEQESMNTEQTQITNLVSRFNTGLSSLADNESDKTDTDSLSSDAGTVRNQRLTCQLSHNNSTQITNSSSHLQYMPTSGVSVIENWARPIVAF